MKPPIIERPLVNATPPQKLAYGALTLLFWALWFYLWVPLLALGAWWLGFEQAYKYMVILGGYQDFLQLVGLYALAILLLCGTLIGWAAYNIWRFKGVETRAAPPAVPNEEIARLFAVDPAEVARWQSARHLVVTHDKDGHIACVITPDLEASAAR